MTLDGLAKLFVDIGSSRVATLRTVHAPFLGNSARDLYDTWSQLGLRLSNPLGSSLFCLWIVGPRDGESFHPFSLGRPAVGYECRIVDSSGTSCTAVRDGSTGRLAFRGPTGITYWNRPELQRLDVLDGWSITDDLASKDADGVVWYRGRLSSLITTAGYKVAPGEVEEVLLQHPAVREVAVTGVHDTLRGEVVCAFVALRDGCSMHESELQSWFKERTAPYKYPRIVRFVEALPRDPVGKVQVRALLANLDDDADRDLT